jgi:hypothetical protein
MKVDYPDFKGAFTFLFLFFVVLPVVILFPFALVLILGFIVLATIPLVIGFAIAVIMTALGLPKVQVEKLIPNEPKPATAYPPLDSVNVREYRTRNGSEEWDAMITTIRGRQRGYPQQQYQDINQ